TFVRFKQSTQTISAKGTYFTWDINAKNTYAVGFKATKVGTKGGAPVVGEAYLKGATYIPLGATFGSFTGDVRFKTSGNEYLYSAPLSENVFELYFKSSNFDIKLLDKNRVQKASKVNNGYDSANAQSYPIKGIFVVSTTNDVRTKYYWAYVRKRASSDPTTSVGAEQANTVGVAKGKAGQGLVFDGGDYVSVPDAANLRLVDKVTMSAWVKLNSHVGTWSLITQKGGISSTTRNYGLWIRDNGEILLSCRDSADTVTQNLFSAADSFPLNQWTHVVGVFDANNDDRRIYVNGQLIAEDYTAVTPLITTSDTLEIGDGSTWPTNGMVDEVAIFNTALTSAEVAHLYNWSSKGSDYCNDPTPIADTFTGTDLLEEPDFSAVPELRLEKNLGKVQWQAPVSVVGKNLDANINLGSNFISLNMDELDESLNSSANVSFFVTSCQDLKVYYSPTGFFGSLSAMKANPNTIEVTCEGTYCSNLNCEGNTLTFTAEHFDGFGGEGFGAAEGIPEFSFWAIFLVMISTGIATAFVVKKR
ncbi:LamG domain-containing protein, partial [Candidatus Woesearchaeota archaeon]|nr:LamG domain-containing protein [Candidatus Woesearchaeota archaeon]